MLAALAATLVAVAKEVGKVRAGESKPGRGFLAARGQKWVRADDPYRQFQVLVRAECWETTLAEALVFAPSSTLAAALQHYLFPLLFAVVSFFLAAGHFVAMAACLILPHPFPHQQQQQQQHAADPPLSRLDDCALHPYSVTALVQFWTWVFGIALASQVLLGKLRRLHAASQHFTISFVTIASVDTPEQALAAVQAQLSLHLDNAAAGLSSSSPSSTSSSSSSSSASASAAASRAHSKPSSGVPASTSESAAASHSHSTPSNSASASDTDGDGSESDSSSGPARPRLRKHRAHGGGASAPVAGAGTGV